MHQYVLVNSKSFSENVNSSYRFHLVDKTIPDSPELKWVTLEKVTESELLELYLKNESVYKVEDTHIGITPYLNSVIKNYMDEMDGVKFISKNDSNVYFYDFGDVENLKKIYSYYMYHKNAYIDLFYDPRNKI